GATPAIAPAPSSKHGHDDIRAMRHKLAEEEKRLQRASEVGTSVMTMLRQIRPLTNCRILGTIFCGFREEPDLSLQLGFVWLGMVLLFGWLLFRRICPRHGGVKRVRHYGSDD
ncbi:MAG: hypothetical protein SGPRY_010967, partial [Prymnesium sp.]